MNSKRNMDLNANVETVDYSLLNMTHMSKFENHVVMMRAHYNCLGENTIIFGGDRDLNYEPSDELFFKTAKILPLLTSEIDIVCYGGHYRYRDQSERFF